MTDDGGYTEHCALCGGVAGHEHISHSWNVALRDARFETRVAVERATATLVTTLQLVLDLDSEATEDEVVRVVSVLYRDRADAVRFDAECVAKAAGRDAAGVESVGADAVLRMNRILRGRAK